MPACWRLLCLLVVLGCARPALADTLYTYDGCTDARGGAIASVADPGLPLVAASAIVDGKVQVRYNPAVLPRLLPESRLFLYAHECARHTLGLPDTGTLTPEQARRADCAAVATLRRSHLLDAPDALAALQVDLVFSPQEWGAIPGPQRTFDLASCDVAKGTGSGQLGLPSPDAPRSDRWNACVQSCAARSFSCEQQSGRNAARCTSAYDQCSAHCTP